MQANVLVIACGALAKEIVELKNLNGWSHMKIKCLPADLHNRPGRIPAAVRAQIEKYRSDYEHMFVAFGDCGTGGLLDKVLDEYGVERLAGSHCYEFFSGSDVFAELANAELGTLYLTDFLARHFDRLIKKGLGLDRHPELVSVYFGNYRRLLFLSQSNSQDLASKARAAADFLGLDFVQHHTGLLPLQDQIMEFALQWQD